MKQKGLYLNKYNILGHLSLPKDNINKLKKSNTRYQNFHNNDINNLNSNLSNNKLVYESFNRKGYNGIVDPTLSGNNNYVIINSSDTSPYQNLKKTMTKNKTFTKMKKGISNSEMGKKPYQSFFKKSDQKYFDSKKLLSNNLKNTFPKKKLTDDNALKWNNIGFKEIKHKNKIEIPSYDFKNLNNNLLKSHQQLPYHNNDFYKPDSGNLGFFNDNISSSYNPKYGHKNYNVNYSLNFYKQKTNPINNLKENRINNYLNSNINNNLNNHLIWSYERNKKNNYKTPDITNSINLKNKNNQNRDILKNDIFLKKNNNYKNNNGNILKDYLGVNNISNNKNLNPKGNKNNKIIYQKYIYDYDDYNNINNKKNNNLYKNKKIDKNKTPDNNNNKNNKNNKNNLLLHKNYKNSLIKKPHIPKQLDYNYYVTLNNIKHNNKNIKDEKYIKNVCKIQTIWRGFYVRELMSYFWSLNKFKNLLDLILINQSKKRFFNNMKLLIDKNKSIKDFKNEKENKNNIINELDNNTNKTDINKLKNNLKNKENDYNKLLNTYNSIIKQFSELKQKNNEYENIKKLNLKNNNKQQLNIAQNNFELINNNKNIKKFNDIQQEQKEELTINSSINKNQKLRAQKPNKENENQIQQLVKNNNILDYNNYLNHFKSNLNIINNEKINIGNIPLKEENNKKKPEYEIINYNLSLINNNNNTKLKSKIKKICQNTQISIMNNNSKTKLLLDNDSMNKSNINDNYERTTMASGKGIKDNQTNRIPENQINLNIELKGIENTKTKPFKQYTIEEQNNNINIFNNISDNINIDKNLYDKNNLEIKNIISLDLINKQLNKSKNQQNTIEDNIIKGENNDKESLDKNNNENYNKQINKNINNFDDINIYENERFYLFDDIKEQSENKYKSLIIEKNENLFFEQKQCANYNEKLYISNNDNLFINVKKKETCDKTTEISEELNKINIEQDNHFELLFKGIKIQNEDNFKDKNNIQNNNNKILIKENNNVEFINKSQKNKNEINTNIINNINNIENYNKINEIEKGEGLEINPYELKRTQYNENNRFISYENKIQVLTNKDSLYTEKSKKSILKIIFPLKIKTVLKNWIKKTVYKLLINNLKKISFIYHLTIIKNNYINKYKKKFFEQLKDNIKIIKLKNYYIIEFRKNMIKNIFKKYVYYRWNQFLKELGKLIISNKSSIIKNI